MITVYYWAPFLTQIATIKSVINSATSLTKYSKKYKVFIINVCGEWDEYKKIQNKNIEFINLVSINYYKILPKKGYLLSRLSLLIISAISIIPLALLLAKQKPEYLLIHLNSIIVVFLSNFFKKTKFILRISGLPKLHFLRKFLWKKFSKQLFAIISPTFKTKNFLKKKRVFKKKILVIEDPVLNSYQSIKYKNKNKNKIKLLAIGRLTTQKNFLFLVKCFDEINKSYPNKFFLNILGEGEDRKKIQNLINALKLNKQIILRGYVKNVIDYYKNSDFFVLTSLWEDPGFVLIEAANYCVPIISSNCPNGPKEFLSNGQGGVLYKSNNIEDFIKKFKKLMNTEKVTINKMIKFSKLKTNFYTIRSHYQKLSKILV